MLLLVQQVAFLKNVSVIQNFNPHGFGRPNNGSILVGDYILPITLTYTDASTIVFQNTVQHFYPDGSEPGATTGLEHGIGFIGLLIQIQYWGQECHKHYLSLMLL